MISYFPLSIVLQQPTSAYAVWIAGKDSFHMCWNDSTSMLPQGSYYYFRILNSHYEEIHNTTDDFIDLDGQRNSIDFVSIQVLVPSGHLPSRPIKINVSGQ